MIDERGEPFLDLVFEIDTRKGLWECALGPGIDHDCAPACALNTRDQLPRAIEAVARRRNHHDDAAPSPFQREEILEMRPLLQIATDAVDGQLLVELRGAVLRSTAARARADRPDRIDAVEVLRELHDVRLDAGSNLCVRQDRTLDRLQSRSLRLRGEALVLDPERESECIQCIEHRQILREVEKAAAVES